jgi:putative endonuclease
MLQSVKGFVYIMTNKYNSVLYTGVTSNLKDRVLQHKTKKYAGSFSAKYNISKLVYFESCETIGEAIKREKQIKSGSRKQKVALINEMNLEWNDLSLLLEGRLGLPRPPSSGSQ